MCIALTYVAYSNRPNKLEPQEESHLGGLAGCSTIQGEGGGREGGIIGIVSTN